MNLAVVISSAIVVLAALIYARRVVRGAQLREREASAYVARLSDMLEQSLAFALAARSGPSSVWELIDKTIRLTCGAVDAVALFAARGDRIVCVYATPSSRLDRYQGRAEYALSDSTSLPVAAMRAGKIVSMPDAAAIHPGCEAALAVPLQLDSEHRTVVYVSGASGRALQQVVPALELLLEQAEPALLLADERSDAEARATFDSLTGLLLREPFEQQLVTDVAAAEQSHSPLALIYVDLDRFKELNDSISHSAGDRCLRRIAQLLQDTRRSDFDFCGRRGGDEFVLVWKDDKAAAVRRAAQLSAAIAFDDPQWLGSDAERAPRITASIGVAVLGRDASDAADLLIRADAMQKEAKERGRGRVCFLADDRSIGDIPASEDDRRDRESRPTFDRRLAPHREFIQEREVS